MTVSLAFDADGTPGYDPVTDPAAAAALPFERVPELTYTVAASYNVPMASGSELDFRVSYAFTDDFLIMPQELRQLLQSHMDCLMLVFHTLVIVMD